MKFFFSFCCTMQYQVFYKCYGNDIPAYRAWDATSMKKIRIIQEIYKCMMEIKVSLNLMNQSQPNYSKKVARRNRVVYHIRRIPELPEPMSTKHLPFVGEEIWRLRRTRLTSRANIKEGMKIRGCADFGENGFLLSWGDDRQGLSTHLLGPCWCSNALQTLLIGIISGTGHRCIMGESKSAWRIQKRS